MSRRRRAGVLAVVATLASAALVLSMNGTAWAETGEDPAPVETSVPVPDAGDVPSAESSAPDLVVPDEPEYGDFSDEPVEEPVEEPTPASIDPVEPAASAFDPDSAELVGRDEFDNTYENADGSKTKVMSSLPVNVLDGGEWVPIETDVEPTGPWAWLGIGDGAEVPRHPLSPEFAQTASDQSVFTIGQGEDRIEFTLRDAAPSGLVRDAGEGEDAASHVEYRGVFPDTDLVYDVATSVVKENFRVNSSPGADGRVSWTWQVDSSGLSLKKDADGNILFLNGAGETVYTIPPSVMTDSSGQEDVKQGASMTLSTALLRQGSSWLIVLSADRGWMNDPARVYPVMVDPTTQVRGPDNLRSYKSNGQESYGAQLGNSNNGGYWRTVVHFPYTDFFNKQILGANVQVTGIYGGSDNGNHWGAVYDATSWSYNSLGTELSGFQVGPTAENSAYDVRLQNKVAEWVRVQNPYGTFAIRGEEGSAFSYQYIDVQLAVSYKEFPSPGTRGASSPAHGAVHQSLTPKVSVDGASTDGPYQLQYYFRVSTMSDPGLDANAAYDSGWVAQSEMTIPENRLQPGTQYFWMYWVRDSTSGTLGTSNQMPSPQKWWFITNNLPVTSLSTAAPVDKAMVTSLRPTLSVGAAPNPDGRALKYWFRVTTGLDARSGAVAQSGWITGTSWTVPSQFLQDGVPYTWTVLTKDDWTETKASPWVGHFTVNQRITDPGPAPTDTAGPVTVNLANGNAGMQFTSPTVSTAGGPLGLSFSYNSLKQSNTGLVGQYFDATEPASAVAPFSFDGRTPVMQRQDPLLDFSWGAGSPTDATTGAPGVKPVVPTDRFLVRWTGFITLPAGDYYFGVNGDDGFRAWINGYKFLDSWQENSDVTVWSPKFTVVQTGVYPFQFEYYENGGDAKVRFLQRSGPSDTSAGTPVPASWFTRTPGLLPTGWGGSSVLAGISSTYTKAEVTEAAIKLTDQYGTVHSYTKKSAGGYDPPTGEVGIAALATDGTVTFTDGSGIVYAFNKDGSFASATTPTDVKKPIAPVVQYRPGAGQVDSVSDPLSVVDPNASVKTYDRQVKYFYQGDSVCAAESGFGDTPPGMLCRVVFPDQSFTKIQYNAAGQLVRITNPGSDTTGRDVVDFTYDTNGRLSTVRNALVNDWIASLTGTAKTTAADATTNRTVLTYDSSNRVETVTLPASDGATTSTQPKKTYTYGSGVSYVDAAGLTVPAGGASEGHAVKVTYNATLQTTSATSAEGLTAQTEWNAKDQKLWTLDAQGLKSTSIYDGQDRVTDTFGPAPASCFAADRTPVSSCAITPAHSQTAYDQGLQGLDVQYFDNEQMAGRPKAFSLGLYGVSDGTFSKDYGSNGPASGIGGDYWSLRANGLITFPETGTYRFNVWADDAVRVYLDDVLIIDNMTLHSPSFVGDWKTYAATAGQTARIRIEYAEHEGGAAVALSWIRPSMAAGTWEATPGSALKPNYGLATSSTTFDSVPTGVTGVTGSMVSNLTTTTSYGASPWLGLAASTTVDPGGLALTSQTTYESSELYNRPTGTLSPADYGQTTSANGTLNTYWNVDGTPGTAICGVPATQKQYGMLRSTRTAPATTETGLADIVTEYVYDIMGRPVGSKKTGDTGWSCVTYDARGRVTQTTAVGMTGQPTRTITNGYTSASGDPRTTWVQDDSTTGSTANGRITTTVDLLGRTVSSTDVWGTVTTSVFNRLGQVTSATTTAGATVNTLAYTYSLDGRVETVSDGGKLIADPTYTNGLLTSVSYPAASTTAAGNGTSVQFGRDAAGRDASVTYTFASDPTLVGDSVTRSQSGRIVRDEISDAHAAGYYTSLYTFDTAGRLTTANIPGHALAYGYSATNTCGWAKAGANGNRTSMIDTPTGAGALKYTQQYCYDKADRLLTEDETINGATTTNTALTRPEKDLSAGAIMYDAHGNVTKLGDQTFTYDSSDRHMTTTVAGGPTVTYVRDVAGNIVARTETSSGAAAVTTRYSGSLILDGAGAVIQRNLSLPGGVSVSLPVGGDAKWAYPNIHGDTTWTATAAGARTGLYLYDPFGQPMDPTTKVIGSTTADEAIPDLQPGNYDQGWVGGKGKRYEHAGTIATIEMGVRMYAPWLGRFLAADPVAGGNTSWYNYPNDPINKFDLDGRLSADAYEKWSQRGAQPVWTPLGSGPAKSSSAPSWLSGGKQAALNSNYGKPTDWKAVALGLNVASMVTGFLALLPTPLAPVFKGISLAAGIVALIIDCVSGGAFSADCVTDGIGLFTFGAGRIAVAAAPLLRPGTRFAQGVAFEAERADTYWFITNSAVTTIQLGQAFEHR